MSKTRRGAHRLYIQLSKRQTVSVSKTGVRRAIKLVKGAMDGSNSAITRNTLRLALRAMGVKLKAPPISPRLTSDEHIEPRPTPVYPAHEIEALQELSTVGHYPVGDLVDADSYKHLRGQPQPWGEPKAIVHNPPNPPLHIPVKPFASGFLPNNGEKVLTRDDVKSLCKEGKAIDAIKLYRNIAGCGLKEAKDAIDGFRYEGKELP